MTETLDDPIEVGVIFTERGVRPTWFSWQGRRRPIAQVTYAWKERDGNLVRRYFTVSDGTSVYELCFDPVGLRWRLTKVTVEG